MKMIGVALVLLVASSGCLMSATSSTPAADPDKPEKVFTLPGDGAINTLSVSESGEVIAVGRFDGTSVLLDRQGKLLHRWASPKGSWVTINAVSTRLGLVVSSSGSDDVSVLHTKDYKVAATQQLGYTASALAFHPKEQVILIGTDVLRDKEGLVRRYNFDQKQWDVFLDTKKVPGADVKIPGVYGLEFTPDGTQLAVLTRSTLLVLDWKSQKVTRALTPPGAQLFQSLHFSRDGKRLVVSDHNRTFWVYDAATWEGKAVTIPDDHQMGRFCFTHDNKHLCATIDTPVGNGSGCWAVYSFPDIKPLAYITGHGNAVTHIAADPKENEILTGATDGGLMRWSLDKILKNK